MVAGAPKRAVLAPEALFSHPEGCAPVALVDIGANLGDEAFAGDVEEVMSRAAAQGVRHVLITGTSVDKSSAAQALAHRLGPGAWFTAGVHPHDAKGWDASTRASLCSLLSDSRCVAIGECGLDFNRNFSTPQEQEAALVEQLELAVELRKPLFLHCRDAAPRLQHLLAAYLPRLSTPVVLHCFTGSAAEARDFLALSPLVHVGVTGWLCDAREGRAEALADAVRCVPLDRLLLETDAPYLVPRNIAVSAKLKPRRNEPCLLPHVAAAAAAAKGLSMAQLAEAITANAIRVFGLS